MDTIREILLGESYSGIRALADILSMCVNKYKHQVLLKLPHHAVYYFKASNCPSLLQPVHHAKPCLDLLHLVT